MVSSNGFCKLPQQPKEKEGKRPHNAFITKDTTTAGELKEVMEYSRKQQQK
jgi:hypothetical protein